MFLYPLRLFCQLAICKSKGFYLIGGKRHIVFLALQGNCSSYFFCVVVYQAQDIACFYFTDFPCLYQQMDSTFSSAGILGMPPETSVDRLAAVEAKLPTAVICSTLSSAG